MTKPSKKTLDAAVRSYQLLAGAADYTTPRDYDRLLKRAMNAATRIASSMGVAFVVVSRCLCGWQGDQHKGRRSYWSAVRDSHRHRDEFAVPQTTRAGSGAA